MESARRIKTQNSRIAIAIIQPVSGLIPRISAFRVVCSEKGRRRTYRIAPFNRSLFQNAGSSGNAR